MNSGLWLAVEVAFDHLTMREVADHGRASAPMGDEKPKRGALAVDRLDQFQEHALVIA